MVKLSLMISKLIKDANLLKKLNKNIYYEIKYPINKIMIIDDNLNFGLLNDLFNNSNLKFTTIKIDNDNDLNNYILNYLNKKGIINKDFLIFKINPQKIKKYGSILKPNFILINETKEVIDNLEVKEIFDKATLIFFEKYKYEGIKYSLSNKDASYFISNVDYIKEKITIKNEFNINIKETSEEYLKELLMLFSLFKVLNLDTNIFNKINFKNFSYENKKIIIDNSKNNYNDAIKFISRYNDYKIIVIGWKANYEDISWLYNVEFERLINKNIQKIYCVGTNAFDIASRLKYASLNEKLIIASSNIEVVLKEINSYNLNIYVLADEYYINIIKGGIKWK